MRTILAALFAVACLPALAQTLNDKINKDELAFMQSEEPAMKRAFDKARAGLDEFLVLAKSPPAHHSRHSIKVGISEGNNTEYFWVNNFAAKSDELFEGNIANQPRMVKNVKAGQRYTFKKSRIVDWTYTDDTRGKMMGNFTLCALLTKEPKADADAIKARFNIDCD